MIALSALPTYKGKPLEALQMLIEKRQQYCFETARDSVIGTAITALVSIRALTRNARNRKSVDGDFTVSDTGFYGGFSASENKRVVRQGISKYSPKVEMDAPVVFTKETLRARQYLQHIYKVTTTRRFKRKSIGTYYVCHFSQEAAAERERKMIKRQMYRTGGLALNALTAAMVACSSRNPPKMEGSPLAQSIGDKFTVVHKSEGAEKFFVQVLDALDYATSAVTGGKSGIDLALMKAANKISGMIRHHWHTPLDHDVGTPFPDIVRSR